MKINNQNITRDDILESWSQGKTTLDWRKLTSKGKKEWLNACLDWTGLPDKKIGSYIYLIDGNQIESILDFYCVLGETFFGYRGYFGQDVHGFNDCFIEIFLKTNDKSTVQNGAKIKMKNSEQIRLVLKDDYNHFMKILCENGFDVELD